MDLKRCEPGRDDGHADRDGSGEQPSWLLPFNVQAQPEYESGFLMQNRAGHASFKGVCSAAAPRSKFGEGQFLADPDFPNVEPETWPEATIEPLGCRSATGAIFSTLNFERARPANTGRAQLNLERRPMAAFGARYYHADLPRFISPDPVGGKPEIPLSWNRYLYCRNDPINYFDPDGRRVEPGRAHLGDQIIQYVERIERQNNSSAQPFKTLQIVLQYKNDYYLQANGVGKLNAIDFKHFMHCALFSATFNHHLFGRLAGQVNERVQGSTHGSYYSPEDVPSNDAGAVFGEYLISSIIPLSVQLQFFFQMIGVNMSDEEALEAWKVIIAQYNSENKVQSGYDEDDQSEYGPTDAAGEQMWEPKNHPDGYAGAR